jgi:hypothetical protein
MRRVIARGSIVAACAAAVVCAAAPSLGYEFRLAPDGTPLRWERSPDPITYAIVRRDGDEIPDGRAVGAIQAAFAAWEGVGTADVRFRFAGIAPDAATATAAGMVIWLREDWPYDRLTIAKTRLHYRRENGAIIKAEILLNARDYRWSADGTPGTLDIRNAATHEIGHFLGLDDVPTPGRTMYEYIGLDERDKTFLSDDELEGLRAAYPRIPPQTVVSIRTFSLDPRGGALRPLGGGPPLRVGEIFAAPCPFPGSLPGVVFAADGAFALRFPAAAGEDAREIPIHAGGLNPGRVRAVSALPPAQQGEGPRLAAIVSTEQGAALALGAIPPESAEARGIAMHLFPLDGADEVVAFASLGPAGEGFDGAFAVLEKRRTGDHLISVAHLLPSRSPGGGLVLSFLRSWTAPDCAGVEGFAVLEGLGGQREIAALARGEQGRLEMIFYAAPFSFLPADGSPVEPAFRADASALDDAGDALGIAALPPDGSGRRRLAALIAR